jgi:single-stranded-DNA-specific exonuclease
MEKKIVRRSVSNNMVLCHETIHPLLARIYAARNVKSLHELDRSLNSLPSYQSLLGITTAAQLLAEAVQQQKKILIIGDFDTDGATSTAVAMRALRSFGAKYVQFLVPNRFAFGYGLTPELVEVAKQDIPDLIVTVDNGIANHTGVEAAKSYGISVLITDHHLPAETLPPADVIVNPNQPGDTFPSKNLAGVGVIFYVMLALRQHLLALDWFTTQGLPKPNMSHLLDLVALGTVADLVPLDANNRTLVYHGLQRIRMGQCVPAMIALLELSNRDYTRVVASDLGFAVASRLNAAGRLDDMSLGITCLLSDDLLHTRKIASKLDQLNNERRVIEKNMQAQALGIMTNLHSKLKNNLPRSICLFNKSWHQGVIGILASRLKDHFNRPTIIFAVGQTDELKGSARSVSGFHIRDALTCIAMQRPSLIKKFGGHAMAAGLTIASSSLAEFTQAFDEVVSQQVSDLELQHCFLSDGVLNLEDFSLEVASLLREAGPWGQAFPEPLFDDTFQIIDQRIVGDKHLKLRLSKSNKILDAIAFFVDLDSWPNHRCNLIHAVYRLDINKYKGHYGVQLIIDYLEPVTSLDPVLPC